MPNLGKKTLLEISDSLERVGLAIHMTEKEMIAESIYRHYRLISGNKAEYIQHSKQSEQGVRDDE